MATIEIVRNADGTSGLHPEQKEQEVHLFSDDEIDREIDWRNYRVGNSYMCDGVAVHPFFINSNEVREKGWTLFIVTLKIDQESETHKRIFRVWFSSMDVEYLIKGTTEHLERIQFSIPMASNSQQQEINKKFRERILQIAKNALS